MSEISILARAGSSEMGADVSSASIVLTQEGQWRLPSSSVVLVAAIVTVRRERRKDKERGRKSLKAHLSLRPLALLILWHGARTGTWALS